jgi:hypothetical protein
MSDELLMHSGVAGIVLPPSISTSVDGVLGALYDMLDCLHMRFIIMKESRS